ncbi:DUF4886 domain-containing protein [Roseinatronobacter sp. S2]|uniref:DUF4886 domain-containing protein n=1 Tax=Roseinatronobacter sp. S2 TaxID=3035471 RepID=UPI00240FEA00|nr:DUF4886 domain-containing protein [Roseinatronobacter sp. S2]WFE75668.1 hypothetical protein P8S53_04450 [Roseinatronobacter sp. S2]
MNTGTHALAGLSALLLASAGHAQDVTGQSGAADLGVDSPRQVLFVGNSYLYYNDSLHNHTSRMVAEGEGIDDLAYRSVTISGGSLNFQPIDHYLTQGAIGYDGPFDVVILQGHSAAANTETRRERFRGAVLSAHEMIEAHGATTALYMTHAYAEGHNNYDPEMTGNLAALYTEIGNEIGALVIPVGLAFERARAERPELDLHVEFDHSHPNLEGSYLAAATVYATLYGAPSVGLEYDYFGRLDAETVRFLQEVAIDTVSSFQGN